MKRWLICFGLCILVLLGVLAVNYFELSREGLGRVHQHLENTRRVKTDAGKEFNTHLPIITLDTQGVALPEDYHSNEMTDARVSVFDTSEDRNNYLSDAPVLVGNAYIRYRGHSSRSFDKKNYLIRLHDAAGENDDRSLLGMGAYHEWALHGPFVDKTLLRNYLWYNVAGEIMDYAPDVRFCELFLNGEYMGVYLLTETIEADEERIDIRKVKEGDVACSYILRIDRGSKNEFLNLEDFFYYTHQTGLKQRIDVIYPKIAEDRYPEYKTYIEKNVSHFGKMLYSFDFKKSGEVIDMDSFVDYFIINEFLQNYDAGNFSTYLYKDVLGKIKMCVWDFNNACDNYIETAFDGTGFAMEDDLIFSMLVRDPAFIDQVVYRYRQLRRTYLSEEYLMEYIDDTVAYLGDAVDRNFQVWGYTFAEENNLLEGEGRAITSYEEAVEQLKNFIRLRGRWMDEHIEDLYWGCHESVNKEYLK